jgi:hypothetical protein
MDMFMRELHVEMDKIHKKEDAIEKIREEMTTLCKIVSHMMLKSVLYVASSILPQPVVTTTTTSTRHPFIAPCVAHKIAQPHRGPESWTLLLVKGTLQQAYPPSFTLSK